MPYFRARRLILALQYRFRDPVVFRACIIFLCLVCLLLVSSSFRRSRSELWASSNDFSNLNIVKTLWNSIQVVSDPGGGVLNFDKVIYVEFPQGSYSPWDIANGKPGGVGFYAKPGYGVFNRDSVALSYKVYFPRDFEWGKGGNLPGLYSAFNQSGGGTADLSGFSCRVTWNAGGQVEAYIYAPYKQDSNIELLPGYISDRRYGISLGRGVQTFYSDYWNSVKLYIQLNSVVEIGTPDYNGIIRLSINGREAVEFTNMVWRTRDDVQIEGIIFQIFFGGQEVSWAPTKDVFIAFKEFSLTEE